MPGGPTRAHQRASAAPCAALGLSLVLPYGYPCAWHCVAPVRSQCVLRGTRAIPVRSLWAIGVRSALLILCLPGGVPLAYFVRHSAIPSAY